MSLTEESKSSSNLSDALTECKVFAERGHALANDAVSLLKHVAKAVSKELQIEIDNIENSNFGDATITGSLVSQLTSIRSNFEILPNRLMDDIDTISKTSFSITLFGRTMAGKSTLMEILTHGRGKSIGKGSQRTTRDVRTYTYRNLQITDVPGIAAFEGEEDENSAFDAAKKGDLILFLLTDDAPQACEAECLNRIIGLGKPVICIINIKADINNLNNLKMFRRDVRKKFDNVRLDAIKQQFFDFGKQYGQDWRTIRFACVHLKSAFLSQQSDFAESSDELYELSRFSSVENLIVSEICKNGSFYKFKAFTDSVTVTIIDALETLFNQSAQNNKQGSILVEKQEKMKKWTYDFVANGKQQIESFLSSISGKLKDEIATFAENNYNDSNASKKWNEVLKTYDVETRASELLKELGEKCENELREISREIDFEIEFTHKDFCDSSVNMPKFIDKKRIWNWTTGLLCGGVTVAGLFVAGPLGWIGIGAGVLSYLGSFLFTDRETRISDARQELEKKLSNHIDKMIDGLKKEMLDVLYNDLFKKLVYPMYRTIGYIINSIFTLSKTQQEYAIALNGKLQEINMAVIKEALAYSKFNGLEWHIDNSARIPGCAIMIVLADGKYFPDAASTALTCLFNEKVWFVFKKENIKSMLLQAVGHKCDRNTIRIQRIDGTPRIAHIPSLDTVDESTRNRIRMAQQITELIIMK